MSKLFAKHWSVFSDHSLKIASVIAELNQPQTWEDSDHAIALTTELAGLEQELEESKSAQSNLDDARAAIELELIDESIFHIDQVQKYVDDNRVKQWFSGKYDSSAAILTVMAGAGGTESQDWAATLLKMYVDFAIAQGWVVSLTDSSSGSHPGTLKSATLLIEGAFAYGWLRHERGNHRIQRNSPFGQGERHTSFAAVEILPVIPKSEYSLNLEELEISTCRSGGKGGQNVNKLETAVRVLHVPTGLQVRCTEQRSQLQNKARALEILAAKLTRLHQEQEDVDLLSVRGDRLQTGFGGKIRSYSFDPYQMVKDERSGFTSPNLSAILGGGDELKSLMESVIQASSLASS